ncbi:MAG: PAS domain S-box protein [Polyangiaceae bacterium]|nr:PAS domain S-box protein [Polyangiaceae bacterium]
MHDPADRLALAERLVEEAPDGVAVVDERGLIVLVNRRIEELFGYGREELVGRSIEALVPEAVRAAHHARHALYLETPSRRGMGVGRALSGRRRDGIEIPIDVALSPIEIGGQRLVSAMVRDVSEHRRLSTEAERARREAEVEREQAALSGLSAAQQSAATAAAFGALPIREAVPEIFERLVEVYAAALDRALERRAYRTEDVVTPALRALADRLGFLRARPRDLIDVHLTALAARGRGVTPERASAYVEEGRMAILELMGHLASYYRKQSMGAPP